MIAAHLDSLLFVLLVAVAVLFQFLAKTAAKTGKDQAKRTSTGTAEMPPPMRRAPTDSDEDRIRKLLEALGQPATSKPPPPVAPRTGIPLRPLAPVQPPVSPFSQLRREKMRKHEAIPKDISQRQSVSGADEVPPPKMPAAAIFEVQETPLPTAAALMFKEPERAYATEMRKSTKTEKIRTDITALFASASGLRDAIILREILGPPRGLRPFDVTL
jgi:hypothetical protein